MRRHLRLCPTLALPLELRLTISPQWLHICTQIFRILVQCSDASIGITATCLPICTFARESVVSSAGAASGPKHDFSCNGETHAFENHWKNIVDGPAMILHRIFMEFMSALFCMEIGGECLLGHAKSTRLENAGRFVSEYSSLRASRERVGGVWGRVSWAQRKGWNTC